MEYITFAFIPLVRTMSRADLIAKVDGKCRLAIKTGRKEDLVKIRMFCHT